MFTLALHSKSASRTLIRRRHRKYTTLPNSNVRNHFFVDTNVLIYASRNKFPRLNELVENPSNFFYYTDTVKDEFIGNPESIPRKFQFIPAVLGPTIKNMGFEHLQLTFDKPDELYKFKADLFIIFEAGFVCYDVIPFGDHPVLLTNNMKLYRKFISNIQNHTNLSKAVEVYGMEHLIDVKTLAEYGVDTRE